MLGFITEGDDDAIRFTDDGADCSTEDTLDDFASGFTCLRVR